MIGRTPTTIRRWLVRLDWPFGPEPPWPADEVAAWAKIKLRTDRSADQRTGLNLRDPNAVNATKAKTLWYIERSAKARLDREITLGQYHRVDACAEHRLRQIHSARSRLMSLPRRAAPRIVGKRTADIERLLDAEVRRVLSEIADADAPGEDVP